MNKIQVVDCTLRDGGYYNNWNYKTDLVQSYLASAEKAGIDMVEIGFRFVADSGFKGPYAFTTDDFLGTLKIPEGLDLAVMVNASDLIAHASGVEACVNETFSPSSNSPVSWVRIAAHVGQVEKALPAIDALHALGYRVGFNIMQSSQYDDEKLRQVVSLVAGAGKVAVLYFADSLGDMQPADVKRVYQAFAGAWTGPIGFHAHNNMGQALSNALYAMELGATYVDSTMLGMGRGAGNAETELLLIELEARGYPYRAEQVFQTVTEYFMPLQAEHRWGKNLFYYLAARKGIHPTYIQQMLSDDRYDSGEILSVIHTLHTQNPSSYSKDSLRAAIHQRFEKKNGSWNPASLNVHRPALLMAGGGSLAENLSGITGYIQRHKPAVFSLNFLNFVNPEWVDYYIACHPTRISAHARDYAAHRKTLIAPLAAMDDESRHTLAQTRVLDFGLQIERGPGGVHDTHCTMDDLQALRYALSALAVSGTTKIVLCGFDGNGIPAAQRAQNNKIFHWFASTYGAIELFSATPTLYDIDQKSIYMPSL